MPTRVELFYWALGVMFLITIVSLLTVSFRYVIQYRVNPDAVRVTLFGRWTVRKIPIEQIVEVSVLSYRNVVPFTKKFRPSLFLAERWASVVPQKQAVLIRRRSGLSRLFVLTPRNPEAFRQEILALLASRHE